MSSGMQLLVRRVGNEPRVGRPALAVLELTTGAAALVGGVLLALQPDGSLLHADPDVLADSPFVDWRIPGALLATLVGGGYLLVGAWQWRGGPFARVLSAFAGGGLVLFEAFEFAWLGFQPLEAVMAAVGLVVAGLTIRGPRRPSLRKGSTAGRGDSGA